MRKRASVKMEFQRWWLRTALVLCTVGIHVDSSQVEGDSCILQNTGASGICKIITKCPAAIAGIQKQVLPQTCGFTGTAPIVCCVVEDQLAPTVRDPIKNGGKKSREKCKEYSKLAYTTYISPVLSIGGPRNESRLECSFKYVPLIVGGTKATPKEFPHSAAIGYDSQDGSTRLYYCGGSLISENFVITAGHCAYSRDYGAAKYVRLGDLNLARSDDDARPQEYDIAEIVRHPTYRPPSNYNDILLVRLAHKVIFNHYVRPLCLYTKDQPQTKSAIASGWGRTEYSGPQSDDLLKVTLDFAAQADCRNAFPPNRRQLKDGIIESQICAGSKIELKDTCQGDSGGPLQIYNTDEECMYWLVGITSFGKVCGKTKSPAVYTRVSHYLDWIEATVWP